MKTTIPDRVASENYRFFNITQIAYIFGALSHLALGFIFKWLSVTEMMWFNFIFSVPIFLVSFFINRQGRHGLAFSFAFMELLFHQVAGIYYIGWESGLQYFLIYLAGLVFFNAHWKSKARFFFIAVVFTTFILLYLFCKSSTIYTLSKPMYDLFYLTASLQTLLGLALLIYYYVQTATKAENNLKSANLQLSGKNRQIEEALSERNQALARLNQELAEAADYVRTILPQPISGNNIQTDWRFIPSTSLGGDAFGYHWLDEDHFTLYLIDVSGHGVGAALLSVSVMNALRSQSLPDTDFKDPESVLKSLNTAFPGEENNDMFFTIWYGVYNKNTRDLSYASGGHPPALLINKTNQDGLQIKNLRTPNPVIGGLPEVTFQKSKHQVKGGDTLYIFSDGVYEVEKQDGSMWQLKDFSHFMNTFKTEGKSRIDGLFQHVKRLRNSENLEDDFTIIEIAFS
jgi:serine phosphatase RsbU (regulator of sigma subunit)